MKPTQQQKDNKLIAEFMGLTIITDNISYFDTNYKALKNYHSDWNWLMQVVEKIESLGYTIDVTGSNVYINHSDDEFKQIAGFSDTYSKIEAVYNACLEFIKWYNNKNLSINNK